MDPAVKKVAALEISAALRGTPERRHALDVLDVVDRTDTKPALDVLTTVRDILQRVAEPEDKTRRWAPASQFYTVSKIAKVNDDAFAYDDPLYQYNGVEGTIVSVRSGAFTMEVPAASAGGILHISVPVGRVVVDVSHLQ